MKRREQIATLFPRERAFFEAAAREELLILTCSACDRASGPFDLLCSCGSTELRPATSTGAGRIYALTEIHRAASEDFSDGLPHTAALVELEEGVRIAARLTEGPPEAAIGDAVRAEYEPLGQGLAVPYFVLVEDEA